MLDAALELYARGLNVLPTPPGEKKPLGSWRRWQTERQDERDVRDLLRHAPDGHGLWIVCAAGTLRVVVLDCDTPEAIEHWRAQLGDTTLDATAQVRTSRGAHYYFRLPDGEQVGLVPGDGWEIRGYGGGVVVPPTRHGSGHEYAWVDGRDLDALQPAPAALVEVAREASSGPSSALGSRSAGAGRSTLTELLEHPPEGVGRRHDWLTQIAGHYARHLPFQDAYEQHVRDAALKLKPPLPEEEIASVVQSIWRAEQQKHEHDRAEEAGWCPVPLGELVEGIRAGEVVGPRPTLLRREDGVALLYPGELHSLSGEPETGKGWIALHAARQELERGAAVLYVDFEDAAASVVGRLLALGAGPAAVVERFVYVQPAGPLGEGDVDALLDLHGYTLVVIDGLTEAYALLGLGGQSKPDDIPVFMQRLARPLATRGAAVLQIDHVPKDRENRGRYAIGGQHKLAGVAAAYGTKVTERWTRERPGRLELRLHKDRHGAINASHGEVVAVATIEPHDGELSIALRAPDPDQAEQRFRPTALMEKVSCFLEREPGSSQNAVEKAVVGKDTYTRQALALLVEEGYVSCRREGQAKRHYSERPYRQLDDQAADVNTAAPPTRGGRPLPFEGDGPHP